MTDNNTALKKAGLKVTLPRLKILEVLQEPDNHHVSAEDLYKRLIDMGEEIGLATVYRVVGLGYYVDHCATGLQQIRFIPSFSASQA